jgi:hypothetical protein
MQMSTQGLEDSGRENSFWMGAQAQEKQTQLSISEVPFNHKWKERLAITTHFSHSFLLITTQFSFESTKM